MKVELQLSQKNKVEIIANIFDDGANKLARAIKIVNRCMIISLSVFMFGARPLGFKKVSILQRSFTYSTINYLFQTHEFFSQVKKKGKKSHSHTLVNKYATKRFVKVKK